MNSQTSARHFRCSKPIFCRVKRIESRIISEWIYSGALKKAGLVFKVLIFDEDDACIKSIINSRQLRTKNIRICDIVIWSQGRLFDWSGPKKEVQPIEAHSVGHTLILGSYFRLV